MTRADYVLGTDDVEIQRLGAQHAVWRAAGQEAWARAGIAAGQTVVDLGCGPGFAALDLATLVGPSGRVIAVDKSQRFLDHLGARGIPQITTRACDLDGEALPVDVHGADAVWARWVFCFLRDPRALLERVASALKPGGIFVAHEYFDYRTWRSAPRTSEVEEFVSAVRASWAAQGGDQDVAMSLLPWLGELGFELVAATPRTYVATPGSPHWEWMTSFGHLGLPKLVELGHLTEARAAAIDRAWDELAANPHARLISPSLMEIVARKR